MIRSILPALLFSLTLSACAHAPLKIPEGGGIYPFGKYQHDVKIRTIEPARTMEMKGVVAYSPESIKVVGLSSFNTTVFKIEENLKTGEIKKEFFLEIIRKHADRFMNFYYLIRELITAPKGATAFAKHGAQFTLSDPDKNGIYTKVHIEHPQVVIDVEVDDYDF
jgi:hypothetical protein